ncbi:hypothetical protein M4914_22055 [Streptomyces somaliensis DSM 40738]|uniref:Uncharacterized protein n=1 Tax=Streptomyces somaliensis (strain ATCC 33201 / DSM 40738 / JCM 12659 / KCTC 9044 / NCTC 11332 / NRRL B-12077 / IP 733) TaxID=1134445 RepID=A0AA44ICD1_STRE0|nr:hypothetical protein [Streptomyces somaliensis]MCQ0025352.1 hypothetical protein [Streptomyces somaliensis DSM 40738]NKY13554.1 hypothetical protein [Streptomyces somaliensis DSM 40738]
MSSTEFGGTLLRWLSESRSGGASALREGVREQARAWGLELKEHADWDWTRGAAALGFIDVDLRADRWSVAPPVLTRLPHADGLAVLTGARTAWISTRVEEAAQEWMELIAVPHRPEPGEAPLPDTLLFQYEDLRTLREAAELLGARYVPCAALQLAELLPRATPGPESAPPGGSTADTLEKYELRLRRFLPVTGDDEDGLYRWRGADYARLTRIRRNGVFHAVEREMGVYLELARHRTGVMRWRPESGKGRTGVGRLFVDRYAPLPALHERAAVLCSGFPPTTGRQAQTRAYDNVPRALAEAIAASLQQSLETMPRPVATTGGRTE